MLTGLVCQHVKVEGKVCFPAYLFQGRKRKKYEISFLFLVHFFLWHLGATRLSPRKRVRNCFSVFRSQRPSCHDTSTFVFLQRKFSKHYPWGIFSYFECAFFVSLFSFLFLLFILAGSFSDRRDPPIFLINICRENGREEEEQLDLPFVSCH